VLSIVPNSCLLFSMLCVCRLWVVVLDVPDVFVVTSF